MRIDPRSTKPAKSKAAMGFGGQYHRNPSWPAGIRRHSPASEVVITGTGVKPNFDLDMHVASIGRHPNLRRISSEALRLLRAAKLKERLEAKAQAVEQDIAAVEQEQVDLYRNMILERVAMRFSTREGAEAWFENGQIPGYGDKTPKQMVANGRAANVVAAINAIEAGVQA